MSNGNVPGLGQPSPATPQTPGPSTPGNFPGQAELQQNPGLARRKQQLMGAALKALGTEMEKEEPDEIRVAQAKAKIAQLMRFGAQSSPTTGPQDVDRLPGRPRQVDRAVDPMTGQPPAVGNPQRQF